MMRSQKPIHERRSRDGKATVSAKRDAATARIREPEEAQAVLEKQLHSLYWWVFNACRIKGFIRAKAVDEMTSDESEKQTKQDPELGDRAVRSN
jgi:hypothetical protein